MLRNLIVKWGVNKKLSEVEEEEEGEEEVEEATEEKGGVFGAANGRLK